MSDDAFGGMFDAPAQAAAPVAPAPQAPEPRVPAVDPHGNLGTIPASQVSDADRNSYQILSPQQAQEHQDADKYGGPVQGAAATLEAVGSGALGGWTRNIEAGGSVPPEDIEGRARQHPVLHALGEGLGFGGMLYATGGLKAAAAGGSLAETMLRGGLEQGVWAGSHEASDEMLRGDPAFNAEAIASSVGLNALLGAGVSGTLFAGHSALTSDALKGALAKVGGMAGQGLAKAASLASGESVDVINSVASRASEAVREGGFGKLFDKDFGKMASDYRDGLVGVEGAAREKAGIVREAMQADFKNELAGMSKADAEKAAREMLGADAEKWPAAKAEKSKILGPDGLPVDSSPPTSAFTVPSTGINALLDAEEAKPIHNAQVTGALRRSADYAIAKLDKLGANSTAGHVWEIMDEFRHNAQLSTPYEALAGVAGVPRGSVGGAELARGVARRAADFTKNETLFPNVGNRWAEWQAEHSNWLDAYRMLMKTAGSSDLIEMANGNLKMGRSIGRERLGNIVKSVYKDADASKGRVVDHFLSATKRLDEAGDTAMSQVPAMRYNPTELARASAGLKSQQKAMLDTLGMKEVAKRLGGSLRPGFTSYLLSRATGLPYGPVLGALAVGRSLSHPVAPMLMAARLSSMIGKANAAIGVGAKSAVGSFLHGAAKATTAEIMQNRKDHMAKESGLGR
jgi:hypothetical protein